MNADLPNKAVALSVSHALSGEHDFRPLTCRNSLRDSWLLAVIVQEGPSIATQCADKIIRECPSALCEKHSLFALLEILTGHVFPCLQRIPMSLSETVLGVSHNTGRRIARQLFSLEKGDSE